MDKRIIIIGCGISGATVANILANKGFKVDIYEKNNHIGGNCYDFYDKHGILVHKFGPHIFHTSYDDVYRFITKFAKLNNYVNKVIVKVGFKTFPLPINFKSIEIIMGRKSAQIIKSLKQHFPNKRTITLSELSRITNKEIREFYRWILNNVYLNYSSKMWGVDITKIDINTINRVKIVLGYQHNYFPEDKYQGLPIGGYTKMISKMLKHKNIKVHFNFDAAKHIKFSNGIIFNNKKTNIPVIYCGALDDLLNYKYGHLPYRSLDIKFKTFNKNHFQENAVINYPADPRMTRICEYKYMTLQIKNKATTISKEYPGAFSKTSTVFNKRYYPIINQKNIVIYNKYAKYFSKFKNFYALGRLAQYKYFDMDDAIKCAIKLAKDLANA